MPDTEEQRQARPLHCPECSGSKGFVRMGNYRSQCLNCNALLKNAEINREDLPPQQET